MLVHATGSVSTVRGPSLNDVIGMAINEAGFVFPTTPTVTQLFPSAPQEGHAASDRSHERQMTNVKFRPLELLTGGSRERPEIIMVTGFVPLFERGAHDVGQLGPSSAHAVGLDRLQTDAGRYADAQFHMRSIQAHQARQHLTSLRRRYITVDKEARRRTDEFGSTLGALKDNAMFLLNVMRMIEGNKRRLDLRHDAFLVKDPAAIVRTIARNFNQHRLSSLPNDRVDIIEALMAMGNRHAFDFRDCMNDLGYAPDSVQNVFSSSKIWLQTLYELKQVLENHTIRLLDIDATHQRRDTNPSSITKPQVKYFGVSSIVPALPTLAEVVDTPVTAAAQALNLLQATYASMYQNAFFKSEEARLAALAHLVSREHRYSRGLSSQQVQRSLSTFYGFHASGNGLSLFDKVIGTFGNNISDIPAAVDNSLASVSQQRPSADVGVLTFESKYVEGDTGTLTPGGDHYFDRIVSNASERAFDLSGCDSLARLMDDHVNQLLIVADGFNLMMLPSRPDPRKHGSSRDAETNPLDHPSDLITGLASQLINTRSGKPLQQVENDRIGAVYSRARNDNRLKAMLFLYTMCRVSRTYVTDVKFANSGRRRDNAPLVENMIERLLIYLDSSVPETRSTIQLVTQRSNGSDINSYALTPESIKHSLKSGTVLTRIVEQFMSEVLEWYKNKTSAMNGDRTRYSGHVDTLVAMVAFDLAVSTVARYSNQHIVGRHKGLTKFSQGQATYAISRTSGNHAMSFNEIMQRLNAEGDALRQMIVTVVNSMMVISNMCHSTSAYFKSVDARSRLGNVLRGLNGDARMLRLLFCEQQVMSLVSTVESISYALAAADDSGVSVLDESEVSPEGYNAMLGYMSSPDMSTRSSVNKKILTVGIPLGFAQLLKQSVTLRDQRRTSFATKQSDIVQISVYKVDVQHPDIIFRPMRYLFELSRFPARRKGAGWLRVKDQPTVSDVVGAVPTRNFALDSASRTTSVLNTEYASTVIAGQQGVKGARAAFDDASYAFLSRLQKAQILHNHVASHLLELYIKLMTGFDVSEESFMLAEPPAIVDRPFRDQLVRHATMAAVERSRSRSVPRPKESTVDGVLFTNARPPQIEHTSAQADSNVRVNADIGADSLSQRHVPHVLEAIRSVSQLNNTLTSLADPVACSHRVLCPKQFDRVFNVIIDPREFEIDDRQTTSTPQGRQALELLIKQGDVALGDAPSYLAQYGYNRWRSLVATPVVDGVVAGGGRQPTQQSFRFRQTDTSQGDMVSDRYFVTIETLEESDTA